MRRTAPEPAPPAALSEAKERHVADTGILGSDSSRKMCERERTPETCLNGQASSYLLTSKVRSVFRVWLPTPPGSPRGCTAPTGKAEKSVWAGRSQGFPRNQEGTAHGTSSASAKEYPQRTASKYPLSHTEDKTKEAECELFPGGFRIQLDPGRAFSIARLQDMRK